jgi:hypothetical protein
MTLDIEYTHLTYRTVGKHPSQNRQVILGDHEMLIDPEMKAAPCGDFLL